jgi:hypothetical protein
MRRWVRAYGRVGTCHRKLLGGKLLVRDGRLLVNDRPWRHHRPDIGRGETGAAFVAAGDVKAAAKQLVGVWAGGPVDDEERQSEQADNDGTALAAAGSLAVVLTGSHRGVVPALHARRASTARKRRVDSMAGFVEKA